MLLFPLIVAGRDWVFKYSKDSSLNRYCNRSRNRITITLFSREPFTERNCFSADRYTVPGTKEKQAENNCGLRLFRISCRISEKQTRVDYF